MISSKKNTLKKLILFFIILISNPSYSYSNTNKNIELRLDIGLGKSKSSEAKGLHAPYISGDFDYTRSPILTYWKDSPNESKDSLMFGLGITKFLDSNFGLDFAFDYGEFKKPPSSSKMNNGEYVSGTNPGHTFKGYNFYAGPVYRSDLLNNFFYLQGGLKFSATIGSLSNANHIPYAQGGTSTLKCTGYQPSISLVHPYSSDLNIGIEFARNYQFCEFDEFRSLKFGTNKQQQELDSVKLSLIKKF